MRPILILLACLALITAARAVTPVPRDQVPVAETWDLTPIFADAAAWEAELAAVVAELPRYAEHRGRLAGSAAALAAYLDLDDHVRERLGRLELYAKLSRDLDLRDTTAQQRFDRVMDLSTRVAAARAFARPEILAVPADTLQRWLQQPQLADHRAPLRKLLADRRHVLDTAQEELLAAAGTVCRIPSRVFHELAQKDLVFPTVAGPDGEPRTAGPELYEAAKTSLDRAFRRRVHTGFFETFAAHEHTLAAVLDGQLDARIFEARARGHDSALAASLGENGVPTAIYRNLVTAVRENLDPLHRWLEYKRRRLGVSALHDYDVTVTLFPEVKRSYTYAEAQAIITAALAPLGEQYARDLQRAFAERWIDVRATVGKSQGAYSSGATYGVHPYVLINWNGEITGLFELAHELGHALHAYYTITAQPFATADYTVFTAEVASTTNEALLARYLVEHAGSPAEKRAHLEQALNNTRLMFYWTTLLADFEMSIYDHAEQGGAVTASYLCDLARDRLEDYWGPAIAVDPADTYIWGALRHVYIADFYLYQYATSFAAAEEIAARILADPDAAGDYLEFLRCGTSRPPVDALRVAGVDMSTPEPMVAVAENMADLLARLQGLTAGP